MKSLKNSLHILFAILILAVLLLPACQRREVDDSQVPANLKPLSFRLKWLIYSSFASHFVALERGYFKSVGLDLKIEPGGPGMDPIRLVATGADDVGLAGYEQILIAREKGLPVIAIGEDYVRSGVGYFSLKSSGITGPNDFVGHKVGIQPGTDKYTLYAALMSKLKIDRSKIEEIPVAFDMSLLFNGTVDVFPGFVTNQPFIAEEAGHTVNSIDPYDYGIRPGGNVYFTSEKILRERRSDLKKFLRAALRGIVDSQAMQNEEVVGIVMKYNRELKKPAELKIWQATKDILLEKNPAKVGLMYEKKWQDTAVISQEYGLIQAKPELEKCFTNDLVKEVHAEGFREF